MPTENSENSQEDILNRLKKIEGQVKGIQKMIIDEKCCDDVMVQVSAVKSAMNKVGGMVMDRYISNCLTDAVIEGKNRVELKDMVKTIVKFVK